jgi:phage-related minor tail protein
VANNKNEAKIRFVAETSDLSQKIKDANSDIKGLSAELRLNEAEFKNTGDAATYMANKQKLLEEEIAANKQKQEALNGKMQLAKQIFGENSDEAQKWSRQLINAKTEGERLKTQVNELNTELDANEEDLENAGTAAEEAGDGYTVLKGAMSELVADGITAVKDGAVELATDSSKAYAQFAAQTGIAADAMDGYKKAIQDVYLDNFGESLEEVAEKMGKVKETTGELDPSKLKEMTENAMTLEDTFDMDMSESLRGAEALMTHFGLTSEQAFDLLAAGAQNGLNYSDELGDNVAEYSGKFAEAGYSAKDYFELLKNGSQGGAYNLDKVNDSINEVTTRLADGTIEEGLGNFSGKTKETFEAWKTGGATQKDVIDSIVADIQGTTNEQEKMNMAALAFGTMAEDGGTKFIEALSSTGSAFDDAKGKMQGLMSVKYDDIESSISGLGRAIRQNVLQPVVDEVTPKVTESIQEITGKIPEAVQKVQEMLPVLGGVAIAVGVVTAALKLQAAVTAVKTAMDAAQVTTLSGLIAAEWAQATAAAAAFAPYLLIVAAIAAVVAAIVLLVKNWDTVKEKCIEVAQIIGEKWNEISAAIQSAVSTAFNTARSVVSTVTAAIQTAISTAFNTASSVVSTVTAAIQTAISTAFNTASSVVSTVTAAIQTAISTAFNTASTVVSTVTSAIRTAVSTAFNAMKSAVTTAVNATKTAVTTVWNGIKSTVSTVVNAVRTTVTTVWNGIRSVTSSVWNGIKTAVTTPINAAKSAVSTTVNGIRSTMTSVFGGIRSTVSSIFSGIQSAITSPIQTAKNTLANLVSGIRGLFSGLHISLPHINLPHFRISGGTPPYGIAGKGTAPSIGIDWYAQGAVLKKATSFGINTVTGNRMVGGEAGYEAVAPIDVLQGYVQAAVESVVGNSALDYDLLADKIANACARTNTTLELDGRQLGRVVRGYV